LKGIIRENERLPATLAFPFGHLNTAGAHRTKTGMKDQVCGKEINMQLKYSLSAKCQTFCKHDKFLSEVSGQLALISAF